MLCHLEAHEDEHNNKECCMEIETNPELAPLLDSLRPTVVVEVPNLDKRNSSITVVPRGMIPHLGQMQFELNYYILVKNNKNDTLGDC